MAAINYCSTFSNKSLAQHFYGIAKHVSSEITIHENDNQFTVCFRICAGGCDTGMLRNLAVRTCEGTFCNL